MGENLHDIDKLFRDPIEDYEEMPSSKVWDAIDNGLDKNNVIQIKRKYNNLRRIAIALLLLLLGTVIYEVQKKPSGELVQHNVEKNNTTQQQGNNISSKPNSKSSAIDNNATSNTVQNNASTADASSATNTTGNNTAATASDDISRKDADKVKQETIASNQKQEPKGDNITSGSSRLSNHGQTVNAADEGDDVTKKAASDNRIVNEAGNTTVTKGNKKKLNTSRTKINIKAGAAANPGEDDDKTVSVKSNNKKIIGKRTKTTIKNSAGGEDDNVNSEAVAGKATNPATVKELNGVYSAKAEKLEQFKNSKLIALADKRSTPDVVVNTTALAKNKPAKKAKPVHFDVMPFYAPQFSFNRLEDDRHDPGPQPRNGREEIKHDEQNMKTEAFGLAFGVSIGDKWSVETGISYMRREISIEPKQIYARMDNNGNIRYRFDCSSGYTYITPKAGTTPAVGDSAVAASAQNTLKYVSVPLMVKYHFNLGKFSIVPGVGAAINFLNGQKIETEVVQGNSKEIQTTNNIVGMKSRYFNAIASLALEYNFNRRWAISLAPSGNFALSSINKDAAVKSFPDALGVTAGIKIKF
ncbi:MAG: outer membrane beta-barrel protein [Bacteroidetes bacterium]|nr:outer membrane beta-barrel protein [Bacteroidota bacterium]